MWNFIPCISEGKKWSKTRRLKNFFFLLLVTSFYLRGKKKTLSYHTCIVSVLKTFMCFSVVSEMINFNLIYSLKCAFCIFVALLMLVGLFICFEDKTRSQLLEVHCNIEERSLKESILKLFCSWWVEGHVPRWKTRPTPAFR